MTSVHGKNKLFGLSVPILLEGTAHLYDTAMNWCFIPNVFSLTFQTLTAAISEAACLHRFPF